MPFRQQKSAKKCTERYLMFGLPNHTLVTLMWDEESSPGHETLCWWFLNRYKQLLGPSKLRNRVFLRKFSEWNSNFQNWSKAFCLGVSEPTNRLTALSTAYTLRNRQGKPVVIKENQKKYLCKRNLNL